MIDFNSVISYEQRYLTRNSNIFQCVSTKTQRKTHVSKNMRGIHCFSKRMYFFKSTKEYHNFGPRNHYSSKLMTTADTSFPLAAWQVIELSSLYCLQMSLQNVPIPLLLLLKHNLINFLYFHSI